VQAENRKIKIEKSRMANKVYFCKKFEE